MHAIILCISLLLLLMVLVAALRSVLERRWPFLRKFSEAGQAYIVLAVAAAGMFGWAHFGERMLIRSVDIAGIKAEITDVQQKVATISEQMEQFFRNKKIEVFDRSNWNRVRTIEKSGRNIVLEVTLQQEPIPNSIEVFEGVLLMPEQDYQVNGKVVRFPANSDEPDEGLAVKHYPRVAMKHTSDH